jgi:hypothetical protein
MEKRFAKVLARTNDATFAAYSAGYKFPHVVGSKLARNEAIAAQARIEAQRFLFDHGGRIAVEVLASIAVDEKMPAGARVKSAVELAKLSNIAISDEMAGKPDYEMSPAELDALRRKLETQRQAVESVLDQLPRDTVELSADHGVFG